MRTKTKKHIYVMYPISAYHLEYIKRAHIKCSNWCYLADCVLGKDIFDSSNFQTFDTEYFIDNSLQSILKEIIKLRKTGNLYGERYYKKLYMAVILEYPVKAMIRDSSFTGLWLVSNEGEVIYNDIQDKNNPDFSNQGMKTSIKVGDIVEFMEDREIRLGIVCNISYYEPEDNTIQSSDCTYDLLVNRSEQGYRKLKTVTVAIPPQVEVPKEIKDSFVKYFDMYMANQS